jgi:hypothetical protein
MPKCAYPAPSRRAYTLPSGKFALRDWLPGEKAEYERVVLNREPSDPYPSGIATLKQLTQPLKP